MLNTINCPHCQSEVSFETEALKEEYRCPHCRQAITVESLAAWQPGGSEPAAAGAGPGRSRWWLLLLALGLVAALGAGAYIYLRNTGRPVDALAVPTNQLTLGALSRVSGKEVLHQNGRYQVTLHKDFVVAGVYLCEVTFAQEKPAPTEVDQLLRESLEKCVKLDPSREIVAMAFLKEEPLGKQDYAGPLVWKPDEQAVSRLSGQ